VHDLERDRANGIAGYGLVLNAALGLSVWWRATDCGKIGAKRLLCALTPVIRIAPVCPENQAF